MRNHNKTVVDPVGSIIFGLVKSGNFFRIRDFLSSNASDFLTMKNDQTFQQFYSY
jgi:hypothetical protein